MSEIDQVAKLLAERFAQDGERGRIVFWRDENKDYVEQVGSLVGADAMNPVLRDVTLVQVGYQPFNVRYRMFKQEPESKFLVYMPYAAVDAKDDWLLDLELAYGPIFTSDRLSLIAIEVLPDADPDTRAAWLDVMSDAPKFFNSQDRVNKLAGLLTGRDDARDFQAKMIAVLLNLDSGKHSLQDIWRELLEEYVAGESTGIDRITSMGLADFHWTGTRSIYRFDAKTDKPTVKDFVLWLFRLAWDGFTRDGVDATRYANIRRDFENWRNDRTFEETFRSLASDAADDLRLSTQIVDMSVDELAERDIFKDVDELLTTKLYEQVGNRSISDERVQQIVAERSGNLWEKDFGKHYLAIGAASTLYRVLDECSDLVDSFSSPEQGFNLYCSRLYMVDTAYRGFIFAWKQAGPEATAIFDDLENQHTRFQQRLGTAWQKQVDSLDRWALPGVPSQSDFYVDEIESTRGRRKTVVIISDGLRYEVAKELEERIGEQNRFTAETSTCCSVLPSYTQLGMAALLPHAKLALDSDHYRVRVDGVRAVGTDERDRILAKVSGKAIQAEDVTKMKATEVKELIASCDLLYVYHNHIDAIGDEAKTESDTFKSCKETVDELVKLVRKLGNSNANHILVTADHGFLYQEHDVSGPEWLSEQPQGDQIWIRRRRFTIGNHLVRNPAFTTFTAEQAGIDDTEHEGVTIQVPNSIQRMRHQGTGVRYVHDGAALQEIVVPVIHVVKGRSASGDVHPVSFKILQKNDRITSGQLTIEFVQNEPVGGKARARTVFAGIYGRRNGKQTLISNETPVAFTSENPDIKERHATATLVLTGEADEFNNTNVELRLTERIEGSSQTRILEEKAVYALMRGIIADDGFDFD